VGVGLFGNNCDKNYYNLVEVGDRLMWTSKEV